MTRPRIMDEPPHVHLMILGALFIFVGTVGLVMSLLITSMFPGEQVDVLLLYSGSLSTLGLISFTVGKMITTATRGPI